MPVDNFSCTLAASLIRIPETERTARIGAIIKLPERLRRLTTDERTGAAIRGMMRSNDLPEESAPMVALIMLRLALGEIGFNNLPQELEKSLRVPIDLAKRMAQEIERDFLSPVRDDLEKYWAGREKGGEGKGESVRQNGLGLGNVVDLRRKE